MRGFKNKSLFKKSAVVNLGDLKAFVGKEVTRQALIEQGFIRASSGTIKILATGILSSALTFTGVQMSDSARAKILAAGGKVAEIKKAK